MSAVRRFEIIRGYRIFVLAERFDEMSRDDSFRSVFRRFDAGIERAFIGVRSVAVFERGFTVFIYEFKRYAVVFDVAVVKRADFGENDRIVYGVVIIVIYRSVNRRTLRDIESELVSVVVRRKRVQFESKSAGVNESFGFGKTFV